MGDASQEALVNFCALPPDFSSLAGSLSRFLPLILNYWYLADKISVIFSNTLSEPEEGWGNIATNSKRMQIQLRAQHAALCHEVDAFTDWQSSLKVNHSGERELKTFLISR